MLRIKLLMLVVALLLFQISFSCSGIPTDNSTNIPTKERTTSPTLHPIDATSLTPLIGETPTSTPSLVPLLITQTHCVNDANISQKLDLQGVIAFEQPNQALDFQAGEEVGQQPDFNLGFYLFDPNKKRIVKTINEGLSIQVSPDGRYLAYTHYDSAGDDEFIGLLDSNGKLINEFSLFLDGRWQDYYNWQNSQKIRILSKSNENKLLVRLLDPFTKEHSPLRTDWDEVYKPDNPFNEVGHVNWKFDENSKYNVYGANILYNSILTHVVYPKDDGIVSLVSVETETELAGARFADWGRLPSWSPNGEYLTILNNEEKADEFYLVTKDGGEFQRITNFAADFGYAFIPEYVWSPISNRIAFWLNLEAGDLKDGAHSELAIIDIPGGQVTRLCVQGISSNAYGTWTMNHPEPVWSPDGRYIMITQWDNPASPREYYVLVIDTLSLDTEIISKNTAPIGWMISEP